MKRENDINNFIFINKDSMRIAVTHLSLIILSCILPQFKFTPTQEYKDFTSWMISNGAFISSKLVPIETDLSNRYVITKERIEKEIMEKQKELITAKTENLKAAKRIEELYSQAIRAMRSYNGNEEEDEYDD